MPRKKAKTPEDTRKAVIVAALDLARHHSWNSLTLRDIATASGISLGNIRQYFDSRDSILDGFAADIDGRIADMLDVETTNVPMRETLFELLATRFELMDEHKAALQAITRSLSTDPGAIAPGLMRISTSMRWTLETAGISTSGYLGVLRIQFLTVAFLSGLRVWLRDDSPDMASTLATLDRWMVRAENFETRLGQCSWQKSPPLEGQDSQTSAKTTAPV